MTTIRYFIPEDGDEELHPNVFLAPKPRQAGSPPTLQAVRDSFPLPGHYHFRFKSPLFPGADRDKGAMAVWMDVTQDNQPVPTWKNSIIAKVTRLSMEEEDDDDDDEFNRPHVSTPASAPAPPSRAPPSHASSTVSAGSGDHLDIFDGPGTTASVATPPNLFDSHPPSAPSTGGSLLDFGASPPVSAPAAVHNDFLGMTAPPQHTQQPYPPQPQPQAQPPMQQPMYQPQQQQQQQQQQQSRPVGQNFQSYSKQAQPFGDLGW